MVPDASRVENDPAVEEVRLALSLQLVELGSQIQETEQLQTRLVDDTQGDSLADALTAEEGGAEAVVASEERLRKVIEAKLAPHREAARKIDDRLAAIPRLFDQVRWT